MKKQMQYNKERDAQELDEAGGYYFRHVLAMTAEDLHSKADIAKELGFRDSEIDRLEVALEAAEAREAELRAEVVSLKGYLQAASEDFSEAKDKLSITKQYAEKMRAEWAELRARVELLQKYHAGGRMNVDTMDDGSIRICKGQHEGSEECGWERYVPEARVAELEGIVGDCQLMGFLQPKADASPTHRELVKRTTAIMAGRKP